MSTIVLCCNTLEDEMREEMKKAGLDYPILWLEAGLHNQPEKLRDQINEKLAALPGVTRVIMALGHCGGACCGVETRNFELIVPKTDDCLSLLLGSMKKRQAASAEAATYFLTAGWLRYTDNLITSFANDSCRFGQKKAERIYKIMLKHYKRFGFINTGTYDINREEERTKALSVILDIAIERLEGDLSWMRRLLTGPWNDDEFIVIKPHSILTSQMWHWLGESSTQQ